MGMGIEPVVQIGKEGVTASVVDAAKEAIKKRELIKVRVQQNADDTPKAEIELLVRSYLGSVTLYQVVVEGLAPALRSGYVFEAIPAKELEAMREAKE